MSVDGQIVVTGGWAAAGPSPATWVYDPASDAWSAKANAPVARAAAGQAVVDGKLYIVGGCTTSACTPMANDVAAYDPASDSWSTLADYPGSVAFASCGGIDGMVYCAGGNDGGGGKTAGYVYDPGSDSWSPIPNAPVDTWASQYTVANGTLVVNGGVQAGVVSNRTFAYDPAQEAWIDMPNSNTARYRGAAACGLYKIGGSSGGFTATVDSEALPGFEECGASAADVEWLSVSPTTATLAPGESVTVQVTMDPHVAQPGTYTAGIGIKEDTPDSVDPVDGDHERHATQELGQAGRDGQRQLLHRRGGTAQRRHGPGRVQGQLLDLPDGGRRWLRHLAGQLLQPPADDRREGRLHAADQAGEVREGQDDPGRLHAEKGGLLTV